MAVRIPNSLPSLLRSILSNRTPSPSPLPPSSPSEPCPYLSKPRHISDTGPFQSPLSLIPLPSPTYTPSSHLPLTTPSSHLHPLPPTSHLPLLPLISPPPPNPDPTYPTTYPTPLPQPHRLPTPLVQPTHAQIPGKPTPASQISQTETRNPTLRNHEAVKREVRRKRNGMDDKVQL